MHRRFQLAQTISWGAVTIASCLLALAGTPAGAADEGQGGWQPLFNGRDFAGWQNAQGKSPGAGWIVEDGAMVRKAPAGDIWTKQRFGDFVLDLEFQTEGNSGIFIRTDKPRDCVQTGIEIQVLEPQGKPSKHSCGAVYDALAPTKDMVKAHAWNHVTITAKGGRLEVVMNKEKIIDTDLDLWTTPGKNPDGTNNKYKKALKDFPREGHIGLQDHGAKVCYRNLKIRSLDK